MWVYPIDLVHKFYAMLQRREQRKLSQLAGILSLVGYSARDLDKKGNASLSEAWSKLFKGFEEVGRAATEAIKSGGKSTRGPASISGKKKKMLEEATENPKFMAANSKPELRKVITETGNSVANTFLSTSLPTAF